VFNIASGGAVNVGTSTGYARLNVWGGGTGTGILANFANNASTSIMTILDNGRVGIGTTSPYSQFSIASTTGSSVVFGGDYMFEIIPAAGVQSVGQRVSGNYAIGNYLTGNYGSTLGAIQSFAGFYDNSTYTPANASKSIYSFSSNPVVAGSLGISSIHGFRAVPESSTYSGTVDELALFYGSPSSWGSGTITNLYGLRIDDITQGATNFAIRTGLGKVSFGDKVGISTTSPTYALSVEGVSTLGNRAIAGYFTATTSTMSVLPVLDSNTITVDDFTISNSFTYTGANGPLSAANGLVVPTTTIHVVYGGTGLTTAPSYGQVLMGNSSSGYSLTATSSLGLLGSSTVSSLTSNYIPKWNGSSFGNSQVIDTGTFVGIGTSSPYAKLSVVGQIVGEYFTATSTTATSTFLGTLSVGSTTPTSTAMFSVGTSTPLLTVNKVNGAVSLPQNEHCAFLETDAGGDIDCASITSYKMDQIYARFTQEDAAVFFIGDSTTSGKNTPRWGQSIIRKWDVPWVGFVAGQFESSTPDEGFQTFNQVTVTAPGETFADSSGTNETIFNFHERNSVTGNLLYTRLSSLDKYFRGDWTNNKQMTARTFMHLPTGSQSGSNGTISAQMSSGNDSSTSGSITISSTYEAVEKSFAAPNYKPNTYLDYQLFNYFSTVSAHTGAVEFYAPGQKGFSLWMGGIGSTHTYDWIHQSDDARGDYTSTQIQNSLGLAARKINTFILQLGINGSADESTSDGGATYKARIENIIDNWKADAEAAGGTDVMFLIINPWETINDNSAWPVMRGNVLLEIAKERDYVSFIDLNKLMLETYGEDWQDAYLEDGIHQNQAGVNAIGDVTWKEISKGKQNLWSEAGRETLTNPNLTSGTSWTGANDCSLTSNAATCTFSAGTASTITQSSSSFAMPALADKKWYRFTYTVSGVSGTPSAYVTTAFADLQTKLDISNGTHDVYIRAASTPGNFIITTTLTSGQAFTLDSFSLRPVEDSNLVVNGMITGGGLTGLKVGANGNVGIGTTTPYARLSVVGGLFDTNPLFIVASSTSSSSIATQFIVDRLGNVGVGTSTPFGKFSIHALTSDGDMSVPIFNVASSTASATTSLFTISRQGNVGIGTTSPYGKLSVVGQIVGEYITATSTTATSTFAGAVGIGTSSPYAKLSVVGQVVADYFTATSSTASTFPYASTTAITVSGNAYFPNSSIWNSSGMIGLGTTTPNSNDFIAIRAPSIVSQVGKAFISMTAPNSVVDTKFGIEYFDYPVQSGVNVADEYFNVFKRTGKTDANVNLSGTEFKFVNEFPYYNPGISATTTEIYYELNNTRTGLSAIRPWGMEVLLDTGKAYTTYYNTTSFAIATTTSANSTVFRIDGSTAGQVYIEGNLNIGGAQVGTHNTASGITFANKTPTVTLNTLYADTSANLTWSQGTSWQGASLFNTGNGGLTLAMSVKRTAQFDSGVSSQSAITAFGRAGQSVDILNIKNISGGTEVFNVGFAPDYKVGVGTTTPWAKFSVNASSTVPYFVVGSSTATHLMVSTAGNTGLGTTSPWRKLSVVGTVAFNGLTSSGTGNAVCIATTKDITDAGGGTCTPSASRFKENVETLSAGYAIEKLNQLRVVSFDYRDGFYSPEDAPESYGMIAEEVEEVDPFLVDYGYDGQPLTLKFEKILGLTVQAVQELSQQGGGFAANNFGMNALLAGLRNLGVEISEGIARFTNLIAESLTVGSSEKPTGITLFDEVTGKPYCLKIVSGKVKTVSGECEMIPSGSNNQDQDDVDDNGGGGGVIVPPIVIEETDSTKPVATDDEGGTVIDDNGGNTGVGNGGSDNTGDNTQGDSGDTGDSGGDGGSGTNGGSGDEGGSSDNGSGGDSGSDSGGGSDGGSSGE